MQLATFFFISAQTIFYQFRQAIEFSTNKRI